jgi:hypothetical protein
MFLRHKISGSMVEVLDLAMLCDPCRETVPGRYHAGEELQDPMDFSKQDLSFPSGETLPRCWLDRNYKSTY